MSESTIRWEQDADNIVTLILDDPQPVSYTHLTLPTIYSV